MARAGVPPGTEAGQAAPPPAHLSPVNVSRDNLSQDNWSPISVSRDGRVGSYVPLARAAHPWRICALLPGTQDKFWWGASWGAGARG
ncbi:hypothetical protein [Nitrospirillum viridazoti]|uniref:hypothetical protein n=1 Tax=Nitrospirillum viridazoti TaxID=3144925 RepID=UPI00031E4C89|nr:hypothetical protein [Nitrospirillum amazonense]